MSSLLGLALDGLRRKLGRNALTAGGVFVGVLALTLIVALGQGMTHVVETTIASGDNLRQVGISPGTGQRIEDDPRIEIRGEMSEARRERLRRAARIRKRRGHRGGRRTQTFDRATLAAISDLPHVESVSPVVVERYRIREGDRETTATATLGIDTTRRHMADRVVAGRYLSGPNAEEVIVHEYLAYQWGFVREEDLSALLGRRIEMETIRGRSPAFAPEMAAGLLDGVDLTEEERRVAMGIVEKLTGGSTEPADAPPIVRTLEIVGVIREMVPGDPFRAIEDGNAWQVDVFLPSETASEMYLASPLNRALGFRRAMVLVDDPRNASEVETELRDRGYRAFSVASVLERVESSLAIMTLVVSFLTGIALFVAALGIVNSLVTSVIERTSEIGLWKAVGATNGQVRTVFVIEAALIGLVGGLLGLGIAALLTIPGEGIAARILSDRAAVPVDSGLFRIPLWLAVGGPALATVVAVLASLYPASRAVRVDPVTALRHD